MNRRLFEIGSTTGATGSALASGAASICCVGPIAITILGVQGAIWAAGVKPYRYYLLAGSLLFIGLAFRIVYRPPKFIAAASCSTRVGRFTKVLLWGSGAIWLAALVLNIAIDQTGL
ncbi:MAG: mercury transporter MerT [Gemmatimonadetes bacterium]|nr:mercury transporter MerT [Gemmatimonadota bacterium]